MVFGLLISGLTKLNILPKIAYITMGDFMMSLISLWLLEDSLSVGHKAGEVLLECADLWSHALVGQGAESQPVELEADPGT